MEKLELEQNELEKKYLVYKHTNKLNHKSYIGITCVSAEGRWGHNGNHYKRQLKFYNAIQKYGWDNFEHIILEENLTLMDANLKEQYYIQYYDSINNGYNVATGGIGSIPMNKKSVLCVETNIIYNSIKEAARMTGIDDTSISRACRGLAATAGNYHWQYNDNIEKEKYLMLQQQMQQRKDNKQEQIECIETNEIFDSISSAAAKYSLEPTNLVKACRGIIATCGNKTWRYVNAEKQALFQRKNKRKKKKVMNVELKTIYDTSYQAGKELMIDRGSINKVLNSNRTAGGYHWIEVQGESDGE